MKHYMNSSLLYAVLARISSTFYREFTKIQRIRRPDHTLCSTYPLLSARHGVFPATGVGKELSFTESKARRMLTVYHIGLNLTSVMLVVRGVTQVKGGRALQGRGRRHLRYSRNRTYPAGRQLGTSAAVDQAQRVGVPVLTRTIKRGRYRPFIHFSSYPYPTISRISP